MSTIVLYNVPTMDGCVSVSLNVVRLEVADGGRHQPAKLVDPSATLTKRMGSSKNSPHVHPNPTSGPNLE
jgi:hypothetical protein